jgi:hypothetical protein
MGGQMQDRDNSSVPLRFRARGPISGFPLSESQHYTDLTLILPSSDPAVTTASSRTAILASVGNLLRGRKT